MKNDKTIIGSGKDEHSQTIKDKATEIMEKKFYEGVGKAKKMLERLEKNIEQKNFEEKPDKGDFPTTKT